MQSTANYIDPDWLSPETGAMQATCAVGLSGASLALALLEQSEDCIKLLSLEGRLEYVNCGGLRALELPAADLIIGKHWWDLWPMRDRDLIRSSFTKAARGTANRFEAACATALGRRKTWLVDLKPLVAPAGPVVSVLCTSRDITLQRQAAA